MKTSEFLRIVKRQHLAASYLEFSTTSKSRYLCLAIGDAGHATRRFDIAQKLTQRICRVIGHGGTAEQWLLWRSHATPREVYHHSGGPSQAMYEYRHRWIDALIAEYAAKGD